MKLVEKKCPNCGAGLSFNDGDTSVKCEYCNKTYYIEKNEKKSASLDEAHLGEAYKFLNEFGKPIIKGISFVHLFTVIISLIIFSFIFFSFIRFAKNFDSRGEESTNTPSFTHESENKPNNEPSSEPNKESNNEPNNEPNIEKINYVQNLDQINKISLEVLHDTSIQDLGSFHMNNKSYTLVGNWKYHGMYLLVKKDGKGNILYDVFKHTYKNNKTGKKVVLYGAVAYDDLKLMEDNILDDNYNGVTKAPQINLDGDSLNFAWGYESIEKLYNALVFGKSSQYTITSTSGLYMGK